MQNDRIDQLSQDFNRLVEGATQRNAARDVQYTALATDLATIAEAGRAAANSSDALSARLTTLERDRPGIAALWGPAGAIGSLLGFILWLALSPITERQRVQDATDATQIAVQAQNTQHLKDVDRRLEAHLANLQLLEAEALKNAEDRGRSEGVRRQLDAVDSGGSRRWNGANQPK